MTTPVPIHCPECGGEQMVGHPAGPWMFQHSNACALRDGEDATRAADAERARVIGARFVRQATATERTLLAAVGGREPPPTMRTVVSFPTGGAALRRRDFT